MKKILKIFLLAFTLFSAIPYQVDADCGIGPVSIDAVVSNKSGAKLYEWVEVGGYKAINKTLNYGTNVIILYESQGYAMIEVTNDNNEDSYYIKSSDYTYKSDMKAESDSYIKYYAYADTIIRNVPSFYSYKVVDTIPANTYFDIAGNDSYVSSDDGQWAVAEYKGKKGWVYVGGCSLSEEPITVTYKYEKPLTAYVLGNYDYDTNKIKNISEAYNILSTESKTENINLKYKDKIQILYENNIGHYTYYYIKTDSINGVWIQNPLLYVEDNKNVMFTFDSEEIYDIYSFDNLKVGNVSIETNKVYSYKYKLLNPDMEDARAIELNDDIYWIYYSSGSSHQLSKKTIKLSLEQNYNYYLDSYFDSSSETAGVISKNKYEVYEVEEMNDDKVYYVPNYGFISLDSDFIASELETDNKITNNNDNEMTIDEVLSPKKFVTYCVVGAALVALGSAITIVIMHCNKKEDKTSTGE